MYLSPVTVDGTTYNFTEESLKELIKNEIAAKKRHEAVSLEAQQAYRKTNEIRNEVHEYFAEVLGEDEETTITRDEVNQLLSSIGADELTTSWSATVEVTVNIVNLRATTREEVEEMIHDNLQVSGYDLEISDYDVHTLSVDKE